MLLLIASVLLAAAPPPPIVVSGATGRVGAAVVRSLLARRGDSQSSGVFVLTRDAEKAAAMHGPGVECLEAAYDDADALRAAFASMPAGGFRLFLACSNQPAQATLETNVCQAAQQAGCTYVVKLSTASQVLEMKSGGPYAAHLEVEALLRELALPHAVLRPNLFMDEVTRGSFLGVFGALRAADECTHPFADAPISVVDVRDVAACAAALLSADAPDPTVGRLYDVTGPEAIRLGDALARAVSEHRGRPVAITPCSVDAFLEPRGLPPAAAASLGGFLAVLAAKCGAVTSVVEELTGAPPRSVRDFVRDHAEEVQRDS